MDDVEYLIDQARKIVKDGSVFPELLKHLGVAHVGEKIMTAEATKKRSILSLNRPKIKESMQQILLEGTLGTEALQKS